MLARCQQPYFSLFFPVWMLGMIRARDVTWPVPRGWRLSSGHRGDNFHTNEFPWLQSTANVDPALHGCPGVRLCPLLSDVLRKSFLRTTPIPNPSSGAPCLAGGRGGHTGPPSLGMAPAPRPCPFWEVTLQRAAFSLPQRSLVCPSWVNNPGTEGHLRNACRSCCSRPRGLTREKGKSLSAPLQGLAVLCGG